MAKRRRKSERCQNCSQPLTAENNFCPECGQENHHLHAPLKVLWFDLLDSTFNLDNRVWRTIWLLYRSPGKVPREYLSGKRASYMSPLRFYVLASALYFGACHLSLDSVPKNVPAMAKEQQAQTKQQLETKVPQWDVNNVADWRMSDFFNAVTKDPGASERWRAIESSPSAPAFMKGFASWALHGTIMEFIHAWIRHAAWWLLVLAPVFGLMIRFVAPQPKPFFPGVLAITLYLAGGYWLIHALTIAFGFSLSRLAGPTATASLFWGAQLLTAAWAFLTFKNTFELQPGAAIARGTALAVMYFFFSTFVMGALAVLSALFMGR